MYQSKSYRLFFKKLTDLANRSISSHLLQVKSFTIKRDLLTRATSTIDVIGIPSAIENGDVVGMYDNYGTVVYLGIVETIKDNTITSNQIYSIFSDNWLYRRPQQSSIEQDILNILQNDFQNTNDTLMNTIFGSFDLDVISSTNLGLESKENQYVVEFDSFLYDIYEKYSIILYFDIYFDNVRPKISIGRKNLPKLYISNNTSIFRNFTITKNVYETNKLIVYGEENGEYRGTWYATTSGITDNPSALNRIPKIKTNIVFSDDDINIVKASSLRNEIYNHEITIELVDNNKLLNFEDLQLGQEADIYFNDNYYNSILTGYTLKFDKGVPTGIVELKFGLVRLNLTSRLFKRLSNGSKRNNNT